MDSCERFLATVERRPVDRPASWLGMPTAEALPGLLRHFGASDLPELKSKLGDDVYPVEMPYLSPDATAVYAALNFAKRQEAGRTLTAPGFFEEYSDPGRVGEFDWPDPEKYIQPESCRRAVSEAPAGFAALGVIWSAHFQDACAAFGMETALMKMILEPDMFQAVIDRITEFYLRANRVFYEAAGRGLHAVLIGNDFGTQTGLIASPGLLRRFVLPGTRLLVRQAKEYGLKVIHHSCGAVFELIGDLIDAGVDAIHPIQALAKGMEPDRLRAAFGDRVSFCGGVDAQDLLVNGTAGMVESKVRELVGLFPTGLVLSPSHEAILPDVPPRNIEAMFRAIRG